MENGQIATINSGGLRGCVAVLLHQYINENREHMCHVRIIDTSNSKHNTHIGPGLCTDLFYWRLSYDKEKIDPNAAFLARKSSWKR